MPINVRHVEVQKSVCDPFRFMILPPSEGLDFPGGDIVKNPNLVSYHLYRGFYSRVGVTNRDG